jgi:thiosulfate dehydrogenase [quinone] large subunit
MGPDIEVTSPGVRDAVAPAAAPALGDFSHVSDKALVGVDPDGASDLWLAGAEPARPLRASTWLFRSHAASAIWLVVRLWLGYQWINAGYQKIWGSERAAFWFGGGAAVKGFASAGVAGSTGGSGGASYGWWAAFLHNFVEPNASWIAKFIALGEIVIGVMLVLGLLTGIVAFCGLLLNVIYMFTGSAGVNPAYAVLEVMLVLSWRNAGWLGLDRWVMDGAWWQRHVTARFSRSAAPATVRA